MSSRNNVWNQCHIYPALQVPACCCCHSLTESVTVRPPSPKARTASQSVLYSSACKKITSLGAKYFQTTEQLVVLMAILMSASAPCKQQLNYLVLRSNAAAPVVSKKLQRSLSFIASHSRSRRDNNTCIYRYSLLQAAADHTITVPTDAHRLHISHYKKIVCASSKCTNAEVVARRPAVVDREMHDELNSEVWCVLQKGAHCRYHYLKQQKFCIALRWQPSGRAVGSTCVVFLQPPQIGANTVGDASVRRT